MKGINHSVYIIVILFFVSCVRDKDEEVRPVSGTSTTYPTYINISYDDSPYHVYHSSSYNTDAGMCDSVEVIYSRNKDISNHEPHIELAVASHKDIESFQKYIELNKHYPITDFSSKDNCPYTMQIILNPELLIMEVLRTYII